MSTTVFLQTGIAGLMPTRATTGSFGYDLYLKQDEVIGPRETKILPLGLKLGANLPTNNTAQVGLAMMVLPRSSTILKYGLLVGNSPGLIDADYTGEIGVIVHNLRDSEVSLQRGDRIAQAVFVMVQMPHVEAVDLPVERDERGGFGSTGT